MYSDWVVRSEVNNGSDGRGFGGGRWRGVAAVTKCLQGLGVAVDDAAMEVVLPPGVYEEVRSIAGREEAEDEVSEEERWEEVLRRRTP